MGRWSRLSGREFVRWLALGPNLRWLDVGCGTGAFSTVILDLCAPKEVVGIDTAETHLSYAQSRISDERLRFRVGDALALPFAGHDFDVAVSAFVLNFVPDQKRMVTEMKRVVCPSGTVAACVWDFAGGRGTAQHLAAAIKATDPKASERTGPALHAESTRPEALSQLFRDAGLKEVSTRMIEITVAFKDFDDYWMSNTGFANPGARYVSGLSLEDRERFIREVKERLPFRDDGSIRFTACAPTVRGIVP
jgi:ubiquinone/menaquinone biosynthesis C-methylase UbiE